MLKFLTDNKTPIFGGVITFLFLGVAIFFIGDLSGFEAKQLIEVSMSGINMLCNTIILASATILALLLTLLGISSASKSKLKENFYKEVLNIAKIDTILFITALILFQLFNIPFTESDEVPTRWFEYMYWSRLILSSLISGLMVTVVLSLYTTVTNIIAIVGLGKSNHFLSEEDEEEQEKDQED